MKIKRTYLYAGGAVAGLVVLWWLWPKKPPGTLTPSVSGTVTSGDQSVTIEDNVLNPNFGLVVPTVG